MVMMVEKNRGKKLMILRWLLKPLKRRGKEMILMLVTKQKENDEGVDGDN